MPSRTADRRDSGAVLVHVAFAFIALLAFTTFVVDYGVFWTARRQAQNSADAGALAGAIAASYDNGTDFSDTGPIKQSAYAATQANLVYGQAPSVVLATDITFPTCPDGTGTCVRVDVYRGQDRGNALPVFFGALLGLTQQGIRATATAQLVAGNASDCLKPWGVIDKWQEFYPNPVPIDQYPWDTTRSFDKYDKQGDPDPGITPPDVYRDWLDANPTGYRPRMTPTGPLGADYGLQINLKVGDQSDFGFATGWFSALRLDPNCSGGECYRQAIKGCVGITYKVGDELPIDTEPGQKVGPTMHAVEDDLDSLVNQDRTAYWDRTMNNGLGGVAGSAFAVSPRVVAVPLVNPDLMADAQKGGRTKVPIANIAGFFVEGYSQSEKAVVGRLVPMPGLFAAGGGNVGPGSFLKVIQLVR